MACLALVCFRSFFYLLRSQVITKRTQYKSAVFQENIVACYIRCNLGISAVVGSKQNEFGFFGKMMRLI